MGKMSTMWPFYGKAGEGVGRKGRDGFYVLSKYQPVVKNPRTEYQLRQRQKFEIMMRWLVPCNAAIRIGGHKWKVTKGATPLNSALSYNIQNAVTGTYPNQEVDWTKTRIAQGGLEGVMDPAKTYDDYTITFTWTDNSGLGNADRTDDMYACVYNKAKKQSIYKMLSARSSRTGTIDIPALWQGDTVEIWMFATTRGGMGDSSNSSYIGSQAIS